MRMLFSSAIGLFAALLLVVLMFPASTSIAASIDLDDGCIQVEMVGADVALESFDIETFNQAAAGSSKDWIHLDFSEPASAPATELSAKSDNVAMENYEPYASGFALISVQDGHRQPVIRNVEVAIKGRSKWYIQQGSGASSTFT